MKLININLISRRQEQNNPKRDNNGKIKQDKSPDKTSATRPDKEDEDNGDNQGHEQYSEYNRPRVVQITYSLLKEPEAQVRILPHGLPIRVAEADNPDSHINPNTHAPWVDSAVPDAIDKPVVLGGAGVYADELVVVAGHVVAEGKVLVPLGVAALLA